MIQIEDAAHVLSPVSLSILRSAASRWPFDARVVVTTKPATQADVDAAARALAGKGTVGIVVNPDKQLIGADLSGVSHQDRAVEALTAAKPYLAAGKHAMAIRVIGWRAARNEVQAQPAPNGHAGAIVGGAGGVMAALGLALGFAKFRRKRK